MLEERAAPAVPALQETLRADDLWLRIKAAEALAGIGSRGDVRPLPDLLTMLAEHDVESRPARHAAALPVLRAVQSARRDAGAFAGRRGSRAALRGGAGRASQRGRSRAGQHRIGVPEPLLRGDRTVAARHPPGGRRAGPQRHHVRRRHPPERSRDPRAASDRGRPASLRLADRSGSLGPRRTGSSVAWRRFASTAAPPGPRSRGFAGWRRTSRPRGGSPRRSRSSASPT